MFAQGINLIRLAAFCVLGLLAFSLVGCQPQAAHAPDSFPILTPAAPATPRINGPKIFGVRPGSPFLFQIAATGERPIRFEASDLPGDLSLDRESGLITGALPAKGEWRVTLRASNQLGNAAREFRIVCGEKIALTPPMGWNSWNIWSGNVSQEKIARAARAMVTTGLREHGWSYVNIDDGWQGRRGGEFNAIQPNQKFPALPQLAEEIHAQGLKLGIYSTPWRTSFLGHIGSSADEADGSNEWIKSGRHTDVFKYRFPQYESALDKFSWLRPLSARLKEKKQAKLQRELRTFGAYSFVPQDVAQWNAWGVDYLKYDWVPIDRKHLEAMRRELRAAPRDIVYSVANNTPFALAPEVAGLTNSWRTSGDLKDDWATLNKRGFSLDRWAPFSGPGHYNDPDMLVIGEVGWGKTPRRTRLNSNEQYTQMSLWCLMSAPLLLGCDLEKLDAFTLGLITNDEVLAIDQDSLGKQAVRVARDGSVDIYAKPLEDGAWAIGFFNRGERERKATLRWQQIGLPEKMEVRDVWRQQTLGVFAQKFEASVAPHGVVLLRAGKAF